MPNGPITSNQSFPNLVERSHLDITDTHIYYDIIVSNFSTDGAAPQPLIYKSNLSENILQNCSEWYFSVIRFSMNTSSLPVFIPLIDLTSSSTTTNPQYNVGQPTIYSITLAYAVNGKVYVGDQTYIQWIPESQLSNAPNNSTTFQDNSTGYYNCYSYSYWIDLVNNAFNTAFTTLQKACSNDSVILPVSSAPFLTWNSDTAVATINAEIGSSGGYLTATYNGSNTITNGGITPGTYGQIQIFFNAPLYNLFNSFPNYQYQDGPSPMVAFPLTYNSDGSVNTTFTQAIPGGNNQILINSFNGTSITSICPTFPFNSTTSNYCLVPQQYSTTPAWNPVQSLLFVSDSIPVVKTNKGLPYLYNGNQIITGSSNAQIVASLTDFTSSNGDYRGYINYTPSGEYRLIDMRSNTPLQDINISVYWVDRSFNAIPFYLLSGESFTCKLLFRSKTFEA